MKKLFVIALVLVLTLGFTTTVFAQNPWGPRNEWCFASEWCGGFARQGGFANCPFRDESGSFLSRADIESNLDTLVANGTITAAQRDLWLERFDQGLGFGRCGGGRWHNGAHRGGRGFRWQQ